MLLHNIFNTNELLYFPYISSPGMILLDFDEIHKLSERYTIINGYVLGP